jgi:hypothetical protein
MTRKNRHHGQAYVEQTVFWIVYRPGIHEKKHEVSATYFEGVGETSSTWGCDKSRAIRFFSRELAEQTFRETTGSWKNKEFVDAFVAVPADEVTT